MEIIKKIGILLIVLLVLAGFSGCNWFFEENGSLSGVVWRTDETGEWIKEDGDRVPFYFMVVNVEGTTHSTFTNLDGEFYLGGLPAGEHTIKFVRHGHETWSKKVRILKGEEKELGDIGFWLDAPREGDKVIDKTLYLEMNNDELSAEIREAISLAINKDEIMDFENEYGNDEEWVIANSFINPISLGYEETDHDFDLQKAEEIISLEGKEGREIEILYNVENNLRRDIAEYLDAKLEAIDLDGQVKGLEFPQYEAKIIEGNFDIAVTGLTPSYWRASMDRMFFFFHSEGSLKIAGVSSPELDQKIEEGLKAYSTEKYIQKAQKLDKLARENYFSVPLIYFKSFHQDD